MRKLSVLIVAIAALSATAAQAASNPAITFKVSAFKVLYGNPVALTGRISSHQAGQTIAILAWKYGQSSPTKAATVASRTGGYWNVKLEPAIRTTYQARWGTRESTKMTVGVAPAVTVSQLVNGRITTHVASGRSFAGRIVELQQLKPGMAWATLTQLPLNRNGSATFPPPTTTGTATLRIAMSVNEAGAGYLGATSHALAYHTKFVSIAVPSTKLLFGNSAKLSGQVSTLKSGETITILAWKYGQSSPSKLGTVSTLKGGHWSFSVNPGIRTGYVARWASTDSLKLLIGVEPVATVSSLSGGRISTHIGAGGSFAGQKVQLQEQMAAGGWRTITTRVLNAHSSAIFPALSASRNDHTLRIAMSVNQAGAGFLGTISHTFTYHGG